jgi:hypothetical protein
MSETAKAEWAKMAEELDPRQSSMLLEKMPEIVEQAVQNALPSAIDRLTQKLGLSSEALALLRLLAGRSNESYEDALRKALTLYSYALDARDRGNRLAILDPDDVILHDIIGFDAPTETYQTSSQ